MHRLKKKTLQTIGIIAFAIGWAILNLIWCEVSTFNTVMCAMY